jgi:hypothetical protein
VPIDAASIRDVAKIVTRDWTKQRKAEERGTRSLFSREETFSARVSLTELLEGILPAAYDHASGGGKYCVSKRQLYYACRPEFAKWTERELNADYFSQTLLVQYQNRHPETAGWKITADPRGTLTIPNSHHEVRIPCGTLDIEEHLDEASATVDPYQFEKVPVEWPPLKSGERYQAVLYIEKEGFEPLLAEAQIAERYDLAILSCKGQSVVAARKYVDEVCGGAEGVPLLVVHDFDKAGFEISQCLTRVSRWAELNDRVAYRFQNEINVTDLGLRLEDVEKYGLPAERFVFKGHFADDAIATRKEQKFLRSNRRVELNAFTSPQFIEWLESKLLGLGLGRRLIPNRTALETAYRRSVAVAHINLALEGATDEARQIAMTTRMPKNLEQQLRKKMKSAPNLPWDKALHQIADATLRQAKSKPRR